MADYDSSLPIRTEADGDAVIGVVGLTEANRAEVNASNEQLVKDTDVETAIGNIEENQTDKSQMTQITDGTEELAINASNEALVKDTDVESKLTDIETNQTDGTQKTKVTDGTDDLGVNSDGSINVNVVDSSQGDEIHEYGTQASGVPGTPNTVVDYTVTTGKTLLLKAIQATASGKFKFELKAGTPSSETTRAVGFGSSSNGTIEIVFPTPIEVSASDKVLLIITNSDKANADVYGFINGMEV